MGHVAMSVAVIGRQCVHFKRIVLHVKLQVLTLAFIEQGVFSLRFHQQTCDMITRVGLDSGIGGNDAIRRQFLQEIIYLRVFDGLRNPLRVGRGKRKDER